MMQNNHQCSQSLMCSSVTGGDRAASQAQQRPQLHRGAILRRPAYERPGGKKLQLVRVTSKSSVGQRHGYQVCLRRHAEG